MAEKIENIPSFVDRDPWLQPYAGKLAARTALTASRANRLAGSGTLSDFAAAHQYFGLHKKSDGWIFRERAPNATRIRLVGDFCDWMPDRALELKRGSEGVWEESFSLETLRHAQHYKMLVSWRENGSEITAERIPAFTRRAVQDEGTKIFSAQVWNPPTPYVWKSGNFRVPERAPRVYEAHVGMAVRDPRMGTYLEFARDILPRIADAGYNTVQLMAVQEHPYYGSFGYQVSSFYAPSSRFGTPEELMELVDTAHELGLAIIMDLVHSHAVKNELEGIGRIDGSTHLYIHDGPRGLHPAWDTYCFDYAKIDTLHFLLSNCRYWLDTFKFDGFRFDGVTSMLYRDHGLGTSFTSYDQYFNDNVDDDALVYLSLANQVIHSVRPDAITVAEDMSGMPGLAAPAAEGGNGFNYRLAMGTPDYWIKLLKEFRDEQWEVGAIWWELTNRRRDERTINYVESHDQALVGDKTTMFRLADSEMYWSMGKNDQSLVIDRAIALHKMLRLVTLGTAGHGYLNFMGNEFGHPEWIDFPRIGNNWSYHHARRQWNLRDDPLLRYGYLAEFDKSMMHLADRSRLLENDEIVKRFEHHSDMLLGFERAGLLFMFNFHPSRSYTDRAVDMNVGTYRIVLDTDDVVFGGHGLIDRTMEYPAGGGVLKLYLPARSAIVLERVGT